MVSRLILISVTLISAAPPQKADWTTCHLIRGVPLETGKGIPLSGEAPVSDLASWRAK